MMRKSTNTRINKRLSAIIIADIFSTPDRIQIGKGCITDFSLGGIRIETNEPLKEDEIFIFKFLLPDGQFFDGVRGKVVRSYKETFTFAYGVRFLEVRFRDRIKLWIYGLRANKYPEETEKE